MKVHTCLKYCLTVIDCVFFSEDWEGVRNLVSVIPQSVKRVVLVSSVGVTKFNELPWK